MKTSEYKRYTESRESTQYVTNIFCTSLSIWYWKVLVQYSHRSHGPGSTIDDPLKTEGTLVLVLLKHFATSPLFDNCVLVTHYIDHMLMLRYIMLRWEVIEMSCDPRKISQYVILCHSDYQSCSQSLNYCYWE